MQTSDFTFELPENLIAQSPPAQRGQSRLMVMNRQTGCREHRMVRELPSFIESGTLMVFNDSRVRRARISGTAESGGAVLEFLLLKRLDESSWEAMVKRAGRRKPGSRYLFGGGDVCGEVTHNDGAAGILRLRFDRPIDDAWLDIHGHVPLPPYIRRKDSSGDSERYQTVYARQHGSAAAPTAGLHFTGELFAALEKAGIESAFITLHVGAGTFLPVRTETVEQHRMHEEVYSINDETARRIEKAKSDGRKILAVGTTSLRTVESAWTGNGSGGRLRRGEGSTSIFIYPGYSFKVVDALFTNFHTPASTLLMLVSAFAGREFILQSYREAVQQGYRFFSYGDACLIL